MIKQIFRSSRTKRGYISVMKKDYDNLRYLLAPIGRSEVYRFCLVYLSVVKFSPSLQLLNHKRKILHSWHTYSTNDALSNDAKVNDILNLTVTFAPIGHRCCLRHSVSQTHIDLVQSVIWDIHFVINTRIVNVDGGKHLLARREVDNGVPGIHVDQWNRMWRHLHRRENPRGDACA